MNIFDKYNELTLETHRQSKTNPRAFVERRLDDIKQQVGYIPTLETAVGSMEVYLAGEADLANALLEIL